MKTDHTLDVTRLRALVRYDAAAGTLHWQAHDTGPVGSPAGRKGRLQVHVDGVARYVHRLIWLHQRGEWPDGQIDHINGDLHDNRIENLRLATNGQNGQNRIPSGGGVTFERRKAARPWRARIMVDGKSISLGYYATREQAEAEYLRAKDVYHQFWVAGRAA